MKKKFSVLGKKYFFHCKLEDLPSLWEAWNEQLSNPFGTGFVPTQTHVRTYCFYANRLN